MLRQHESGACGAALALRGHGGGKSSAGLWPKYLISENKDGMRCGCLLPQTKPLHYNDDTHSVHSSQHKQNAELTASPVIKKPVGVFASGMAGFNCL